MVCSQCKVSVLLLLLPALCWILSYFQNRLLINIITFMVVILLIILTSGRFCGQTGPKVSALSTSLQGETVTGGMNRKLPKIIIKIIIIIK